MKAQSKTYKGKASRSEHAIALAFGNRCFSNDSHDPVLKEKPMQAKTSLNSNGYKLKATKYVKNKERPLTSRQMMLSLDYPYLIEDNRTQADNSKESQIKDLSMKMMFKTIEYSSLRPKYSSPINFSNIKSSQKSKKTSSKVIVHKKAQHNKKPPQSSTEDSIKPLIKDVVKRTASIEESMKSFNKEQGEMSGTFMQKAKTNKKRSSIETVETKSIDFTSEKTTPTIEKLRALKERLKLLLTVEPNYGILIKRNLSKIIGQQ